MSVFTDFQRAWAARFPGCELPQAWEEDVRANLAKHSHKVALLKEELEKEKFYVEYLERLLSDVEKHRRRSHTKNRGIKYDLDLDVEDPAKESAIGPNNNNNHINNKNREIEIQNGESEVTRALAGVCQVGGEGVKSNPKEEKEKEKEGKSKKEIISGKESRACDDLVSSLCGADQNVQVGIGGGDDISKVTGGTSWGEVTRPGLQHSDSDGALLDKGSQYVTVIKVNGYAASKSDDCLAAGGGGGGGSGETAKANPSLRSKVPPKPPPKRSRISATSANLTDPPENNANESSAKDTGSVKRNSVQSRTKDIESSNKTDGAESVGDAGVVVDGATESNNDASSPKEDNMHGKNSVGTNSSESVNLTSKLVSVRSYSEREKSRSFPTGACGSGNANSGTISSENATEKVNPEVNGKKYILEKTKPGDSADDVKNEASAATLSPTAPDVTGEGDIDDSMGSLANLNSLATSTHDSSSGDFKSEESIDLDPDYVIFSSDLAAEYDDHTMKSQASGQSGYSSHSGGGLSDMDGVTSSPVPPDSDNSSPKYSDYVNIDYFLRRKAHMKHRSSSQSVGDSVGLDSDDEEMLGGGVSSSAGMLLATLASDAEDESNDVPDGGTSTPADDVFDIDSGVYSSSLESTSYVANASSNTLTPPSVKKVAPPVVPSNGRTRSPLSQDATDGVPNKAEAERIAMYRCIISSILESETIYLECLTVLKQYMRAIQATIGTSQPVMSQDDFAAIFFKISELHTLHEGFLDGMRNRTSSWDGKLTIGDHFKILASKLGVYGLFLQNYPRAIDTVRKCSAENVQFCDITKAIKLRSLKGQAMSLEDLLHKPVARVQKNALVLHDLLKYTPESHPDHKTLKTALTMTQCFLNEFNMMASESMFPANDRNQRHLVKNSFIVELSEGHRKLRHLFLFNDVIVCAKYKASGREKFTFEVKWYIPLVEVVLPSEEDSKEIRESSPANILSLKTQASTARDQILKEERSSQGKERATGRIVDKHRKKLAELEAQLVLASPNLAFRVSNRQGKTYTFFLSSEFEREQWMEAINTLRAAALPVNPNLSMYELQTWITACRKFLKTNMGAFLLRSGKEDLMVGDLHIGIRSLEGLPRPADLFLSLEVDSYGHFFRKAKTKVSKNTMDPIWNQDFIIDLEGSQSLRILCYEQHPEQGVILRGRTTLELSRQWLSMHQQEKSVTLQEFTVNMSIKYVPCEMTLRRAPSAKPCGLFGVKINQVCKKEKRPVPFLITSCIREVERRGMSEVGIYRVSGSASDVQKLKKSFETNAYEAEQLQKEVDIHSVTGLLKLYLRELPEALFTDDLYPKFFEAFSFHDQDAKKSALLSLFTSLPPINQNIIMFLIDHMVRINQQENSNKMSLHNLATVFGPTLLRPGTKSDSSTASDLLAASTIDVMAQAGILYFFLRRCSSGEPIPRTMDSV